MADVLSRPEANTKNQNLISAELAQEMSPEFSEMLLGLNALQDEDETIKELKTQYAIAKELPGYHLANQILYKVANNQHRAIIPTNVAPKFIQECHEIYGHIGARTCYYLLREDFTCPHLYKLTRQTLRKCVTCQKTKVCTPGTFAEMKNILPLNPNELISIDFYGPLPTAKYGMRFLLVAIDVFSKLTTLYPLRKATTRATIKCLLENYIPKYGKPQAILSDQGTQFTARNWAETLQKQNMKKILTAIRHPQANPVERTNRELSRFCRAFLQQQHHKWTE